MIEKFLKKKFKLLKNQKGLTLIELLAVVVILGIIAAIAIPAIGKIIDNSRIKGVKADAANVLNAGSIYFTDKGISSSSVTIEVLKDSSYLDNAGQLATSSSVTKTIDGTLQISGTGKAGSKTIRFSSATLTDIKVESAEGSSPAVVITP